MSPRPFDACLRGGPQGVQKLLPILKCTQSEKTCHLLLSETLKCSPWHLVSCCKVGTTFARVECCKAFPGFEMFAWWDVTLHFSSIVPIASLLDQCALEFNEDNKMIRVWTNRVCKQNEIHALIRKRQPAAKRNEGPPAAPSRCCRLRLLMCVSQAKLHSS